MVQRFTIGQDYQTFDQVLQHCRSNNIDDVEIVTLPGHKLSNLYGTFKGKLTVINCCIEGRISIEELLVLRVINSTFLRSKIIGPTIILDSPEVNVFFTDSLIELWPVEDACVFNCKTLFMNGCIISCPQSSVTAPFNMIKFQTEHASILNTLFDINVDRLLYTATLYFKPISVIHVVKGTLDLSSCSVTFSVNDNTDKVIGLVNNEEGLVTLTNNTIRTTCASLVVRTGKKTPTIINGGSFMVEYEHHAYVVLDTCKHGKAYASCSNLNSNVHRSCNKKTKEKIKLEDKHVYA